MSQMGSAPNFKNLPANKVSNTHQQQGAHWSVFTGPTKVGWYGKVYHGVPYQSYRLVKPIGMRVKTLPTTHMLIIEKESTNMSFQVSVGVWWDKPPHIPSPQKKKQNKNLILCQKGEKKDA